MNKRIDSVDIVKGIGIILVVLGHTGIPNILSRWIWSFHMPLFFFISGMLFNISNYSTSHSFIIKRINSLIVPYVFFSIIVFFWTKALDSNLIITTSKELYNGWTSIALWFIPVLFFTEIGFYFTRKLFKKEYLYLIITALSLIGYVFYIKKYHFPFKFEVVFTSLFFYGIGNIIGIHFKDFFENKKISFKIIVVLVLFAISFLLSNVNSPNLDMAFNILGNYIPVYIAALVGIIFLFAISITFSGTKLKSFILLKKILIYLGKNTLVILAFHQVVLVTLIALFERIKMLPYLNSGIRHLLLWIILYIFISVINNNIPWILGKSK